MSAGGDRSEPILGVILAAGRGTRLAPFSERYPKPILPILGKPLLRYQVEWMRELGIRRVFVVIGHLGYEIVRALGDGSDLGVSIEYVEQQHALGIAHAVTRLEEHIDRPFLLFLGDIFFVHTDLRSMIRCLRGEDVDGVLAVKEEPSVEAIQRNFAVLESDEGYVTRVIEKPHHPPTRLKGCGIYLFDLSFFDAARRTPRTAMRDEYEITDAIQIFLDDGHRVRAARVIEDDLNLSYPSDLLEINLRVLGDRELVGNQVKLPPGCRVERSVIMDGAVVEQPVTIRESLIFPGARVSGSADLVRQIVTPDALIDCR
ncbi:MAG: sugar phosphate nucleotidyltransferase [Myxococcota bacterium]